MKKVLQGLFKSYNKDTDLIEFIASTAAIDREGESIDPKGWDLSNVGKNLPLLWAHDAHSLPIGRVVDARVEDSGLVATVEFAHKVDDFAKKVYEFVKAGFLNAVSVGFMPKAYDAQGQMVSQELLELSLVNVPANQEALRNNDFQAFQKSLKNLEKKEIDKVEKTPACRMEGESKDECVSRKIPEIKKENPDMEQEQCVAMAENMCKKACGEEKKEGRIISEKNRNTVRIAIDAMGQAQTALSDLLNATEPPAKKGGVEKTEQSINPRNKGLYKTVRLMDKVVEAVIHEIKEGGEINK